MKEVIESSPGLFPFFADFAGAVEGSFYYLNTGEHLAVRKVYATDASMYQELPVAVLLPHSEEDIRKALLFATAHQLTLIPRAAGTSLAGQVVGSGIVVDISHSFTRILELNETEGWVRVQPGVIRDDLNTFLRSKGWLFGPETSTANRAMIGGMIGNNSCGLHSLIWGAVRDHLLEIKGFLSNGDPVVVEPLDRFGLREKLQLPGLEGDIYRSFAGWLDDPARQSLIRSSFPDPGVKRRNSGYALDAVLEARQKDPEGIDLCKLIAGSEGTLMFITEAKLKLIPLPPPETALVAVHCHSLRESLLANQVALKHNCAASELVDDYILGFARQSPRFQQDAGFVEGNPKAILLVEFFAKSHQEAATMADTLRKSLEADKIGYAYPVLFNADTQKAWELRKAGLGLIRNLPGDAQPVNLIEDSAVTPDDLPDYMDDVAALLESYGLRYCVYAHAGPGELHIEPVINLKTENGQRLLRKILTETAVLVKKYKGALSGEHGDGRLRGEMIPFMMGEEMYSWFREVKSLFDPAGVLNRSKIVDTPPMDSALRYSPQAPAVSFPTYFDFSDQESMLRLTEKCSGSGDCRRSALSGGLMCPSYMATRAEKDTTRARANILRQYITANESLKGPGEEEVKEILDLCLSCKGCKTECPSGVDVTRLKAEFTQQYYDRHGIPFRSKMIGQFAGNQALAYQFRWIYNALFALPATRSLLNRLVGFHPKRSIPLLTATRFSHLARKASDRTAGGKPVVYVFCDEFTEFLDSGIGDTMIRFMEKTGYEVKWVAHAPSGRALLSKGMLKEVKPLAEQNVALFSNLITADTPLVGLEPSAILSFRDEYPVLVPQDQQARARTLASHVFTFEEWVYREMKKGRIKPEIFHDEEKSLQLHVHCHQKAMSEKGITAAILSLPPNYTVKEIPSGCCGMAGSFGYEKEHYDLSMQIGELVLFPALRKKEEKELIAAAGTSCRHQIKDGTGLNALHPVEILYQALR